jgi:CBS domain-containing protein
VVTARDIMVANTPSIGSTETLGVAAAKMRDLKVGSLPICEADGQLSGILTDRDIVVRCIANGGDPYTAHAGEYADSSAPAIDIDDSVETALMTMAQHRLHQLPVIDGATLVGMLADADVAQSIPEAAISDVLDHPWAMGRAS